MALKMASRTVAAPKTAKYVLCVVTASSRMAKNAMPGRITVSPALVAQRIVRRRLFAATERRRMVKSVSAYPLTAVSYMRRR